MTAEASTRCRHVREWGDEHIAKNGLTEWRFAYDNAKTRAGQCDYQRKRITLSRHFVIHCPPEAISDIFMHELAHALLPPGEGHSARWSQLARSLGSSGKRCHPYCFYPPKVLAICRCMHIAVWRHRASRKLRQQRCSKCGCAPLVSRFGLTSTNGPATSAARCPPDSAPVP